MTPPARPPAPAPSDPATPGLGPSPMSGTSSGTSSGSSSGASGRLRGVLGRQRARFALRLGALLATVAAAGAFAGSGRWAWAAAGAAAAFAQVVPLLRAVERPTRDLLRFLEGVRNDDLSMRFSGARGPFGKELQAAFEAVTEAFRRVRSEREEGALYLQTVVRHVGVALLAVRDDGTVALFNEAAARLLGLPHVRTAEALGARHPALARALEAGRPGARALVEVERDEQPLTLVVHTTRFRLGDVPYTLASLQDIRPELEAKEIEAWADLTRVLTHEITNSVAPVASLAATASGLLGDEADGDAAGGAAGGEDARRRTRENVREALRVIERRCEGLVHFVEAYRSLASLPAPRFGIVPARGVLGGVCTLLRATAAERGVALALVVEPEGLDLVADADLLEQALVNVLLNAIQACAGQPGARVEVRGRAGPSGRPVVEVVDNGPGILADVQARVFTPFFTTRPEGSGIGLSLSRQIMRLHGGTLTVRSTPGEGATFAFRF